jgi:hypothetical protein
LVDPLSSKMRTKLSTERNFWVRFSRRKSIQCSAPHRVTSNFLCCVNISTHISDDNVSFPGLAGGLCGQNLPYKYKFKIPVHNCHREADYLVNGPYYGSASVRVMITV